MKRIAILAVPLLVLCAAIAHESFAVGNVDADACHHGLDSDKGKVHAISDATKRGQAYHHLKAAYSDELASNYTGCLDELKAAEALMQ